MDKDFLSNIDQRLLNLRERNSQINSEIERINDKNCYEIKVCDETSSHLNALTKEFKTLTSVINKKDISFFVLSVILQYGMKYIIKRLREMSDKEIAEKTFLHDSEHSDRRGERYYVTKEEIVTNPVPFDAIVKEHTNEWYKINKKIKPGFSGLNHRFTALGHDPILGLFFGTANIMTSTITRYDFLSWHVDSLEHSRIGRNSKLYVTKLDTICERASTLEIFSRISQRITDEGKDGWITLGYALLKEIVHLCSDLPSKQSLPIPVVSVFSPELAKTLSLYGLNTGTVLQGGIGTKTINWLISYLHRLTKEESEDEKLFQVRTKKIIMYSNLVATYTDIGLTLCSAYLGDKNALRKFDLGGYAVTLSEIINSHSVIAAIESEFFVNGIINILNQDDEYETNL